MDAASSQGSFRHVSFSVATEPQSRSDLGSAPAYTVEFLAGVTCIEELAKKTGESESIAKYHFNPFR